MFYLGFALGLVFWLAAGFVVIIAFAVGVSQATKQ
jgi:hypothetical protein